MIRIHHTNQKIIRVPFPYPKLYRQNLTYKPSGLWYGINWEWEEWCKENQPAWLHKNHFYLEIDTEKILVLDSSDKIIEFNDEYGERPKWANNLPNNLPDGFSNWNKCINWEKVAEKYSGIEINSYSRWQNDFMWHSGWDVSSGCIWNLSCLKSVKQIEIKK